MDSHACRMCLLAVLLVVAAHASVPRGHSSTGLTTSAQRPKLSYFCESHNNNGRNVIVATEPTYITNAGYYRKDSPGYSPFQKCTWQLHASHFYDLVNLEVIDIDLEQEPNCRNDYLALSDGKGRASKRLSQLCGLLGESRKFTSTSNDMTLEFHTTARNNSRGFKVKVYSTRSVMMILFYMCICALMMIAMSICLSLMTSWLCSKSCRENRVEALDEQEDPINNGVSFVRMVHKIPPN